MSRPNKNRRKVYVAMSGGVDSSVAAALLKKQGYDVTGVFMRPWSPEVDSIKYKVLSIKNRNQKIHNTKYEIHNTGCLWQKDREDAMKVAAKIGIPLLTWDFSKEYKKEVADYMIREYKAGRTPNPDVMCNKHIKFGLFLEKAIKEGADFIATGHYVRLRRKTLNSKFETLNKLKTQNSKFKLLTAKDKNKDQSYFLWTLAQEQLRHCLFPIGDYMKPEVRKLAKKFGLPTADKKDSQGVCFIGPLDMKEFLKKYIKPKRGEIRLLRSDLKGVPRFSEWDSHSLGTLSDLENSSLVGYHDGVSYYTIGQRHGLDIKNGQGPYYIIEKDIVTNTIVVARGNDDVVFREKETYLINVNFIASQTYSQILQSSFGPAKRGQETTPRKNLGISVSVRVRYRQPIVRAQIVFADVPKESRRFPAYKSASVRVLFEKPQKAITPGQSAVFYKGDELLGGGIIK